MSLQVILACSAGTILEWYDFSLYAYLAPIISLLYFPHEDSFSALMLTYLIFAVGFIVRPLGAIAFGHYGDKIGRKKILVISIVLMASITCLIGLLPTYDQAGIAAAILLTLLRVFQGLVIGGESTGAGSLVIESAPEKKRGMATALVWASSGVGILLSSVVVTVLTILFNHQQMLAWGWRIPFFLGAFTGLIGYFIRKNIPESDCFNSIKNNKKIAKFPLVKAFRFFKRKIMIATGLYSLCAITTYLIFVFMPVYASKNIGLPFDKVMMLNTLTMVLMVMLVPMMGHYSDIFGRRLVLMIGATGFLFLGLPFYFLISHGSFATLIFVQIIFAILTACFQGPISSAVLEMFPTHVRYSAAAFGYNLSYSLFGGTTPLIAVYLIHKFKNNAAPSLYLLLGAFIAVLSITRMHETSKTSLP